MKQINIYPIILQQWKQGGNSQMNQQQIQSDIYFEGSKDQLYALLYPLTGPSSPIFDHLQFAKINFNNSDKKLQFVYKTKDFSNIDRQQQQIVYQSTCLPTHSNYFYSVYLPDENAYVWRSVHRMLEMRPANAKKQNKQKQKPKESHKTKNANQIEAELPIQQQTKELKLVEFDVQENIIRKQMEKVPQTQKLNKNWDISKDQYLSRLFE